MRSISLSPLLVVLVVFLVNDSVNCFVHEALNKVKDNIGDVVENVACDTVGDGLDKITPHLSSVCHCDKEEEKKHPAHCKIIKNKALIFKIFCILVNEHKKEVLTILLGCLDVKDKKQQEHTCHEKLINKLIEIAKEVSKVAEMLKEHGLKC